MSSNEKEHLETIIIMQDRHIAFLKSYIEDLQEDKRFLWRLINNEREDYRHKSKPGKVIYL